MTATLAIDPGPEYSAWVEYWGGVDGFPVSFGKDRNAVVLTDVVELSTADYLAIEMVASYGMAVGAEVFETCVWAGRLIQAWVSTHAPDATDLSTVSCVYRRDVKLHLCHAGNATDSNVRQALIDRYGPGKPKAIGLKKTPGPLYGVSGDVWQALAVAVTVADKQCGGPRVDGPPQEQPQPRIPR